MYICTCICFVFSCYWTNVWLNRWKTNNFIAAENRTEFNKPQTVMGWCHFKWEMETLKQVVFLQIPMFTITQSTTHHVLYWDVVDDINIKQNSDSDFLGIPPTWCTRMFRVFSAIVQHYLLQYGNTSWLSKEELVFHLYIIPNY